MVGDLVRERRAALGLTQADLALRTGLRQTYISQVEKGEIAMPRDHNLDALGRALGIAREEFYRAAGYFDGLPGTADDGDPDDPGAATPVDELVAEFERQLFLIPGLRAQLERRKAEDPEDYAPLIRNTARHLGILAGSLLREPGNGERA